jgi:hypothetical protein
MTDELSVSHDENAMKLTPQDIEILAQVDTYVQSAIEMKDISDVINFGRQIIKGFRIRGVVLAKLLYELIENWDKFGVDDNYMNVITNEMGVKTVTVVKYSHAWRVIFIDSGIADSIKQRLLAKPIKSLLLLPALIEDGDVDWQEIIDADTHEDLRDLIREKRGLVTSSATALYIRMDAISGQLFVKQGDKPFEAFGILAVDKAKTNPIVNHAIERICRDARIIL